jgi:hypothetical protein
MRPFTVLWITWAIFFAVVEFVAIQIMRKTGDSSATLSWHLAEVFQIKHPAGRVAWTIAVPAFAMWLWNHLLTTDKREDDIS